jgi:cytochrome c oxidase assembly protein subunit 15
LANHDSNSTHPSAAAMTAPRKNIEPLVYRQGPHWVAVFAAVVTWPLLLVGGTVTVLGVGMAVPDWPTTFGVNMFLYRFWDSSWGVFIEHSHRLYGAAVGLACIVLAAWLALGERRGWMKVLGAMALVAVIVQGILGGLRVRSNSRDLAFIHGCTAEAFFGLMVALCVFTGRGWIEAGPDRTTDHGHLRRRSLVTLVLVYAQIIAGAWVRHYRAFDAQVVHALLGAAVWGHALALWWRVERAKSEEPGLLASSRAMGLAVSLQVALGAVAWLLLRPFDGIPRSVYPVQALVRIAHQGVGALLLASSLSLALRACRLLRSLPAESTASAASTRLEAMA